MQISYPQNPDLVRLQTVSATCQTGSETPSVCEVLSIDTRNAGHNSFELAIGTSDGRVQVWNFTNNSPVLKVTAHLPADVRDARMVKFVGDDGQVIVAPYIGPTMSVFKVFWSLREPSNF